MRAHPTVKKLLLTALTLVAAAPLISAQDSPAPGPQTTFRATSNYVSTSLIVRDKEGRFIQDLKPNEIKIYEDGVQQKISIFIPVVGGQVLNNTMSVSPLPGPTRSEGLILPPSRVATDTSGRIFIIFIDDLHLAPSDTPKAKDVLKTIRDTLVHDNDLVGFVSTGTSTIAMEPTYDFGHRRFDEAIAKVMGSAESPDEIIQNATLEGADGPTGLRYNAHVAFSTVYDMLDELAKITDRRKSFIYMSSGYSWDPFTNARYQETQKYYQEMGITPNDPTGSAPPEDPNNPIDPTKLGPYDVLADQTYRRRTEFAESDLDRELVEVVAAARRANVAFYAVDPRGLTTGIEDASMQHQISYADMRDFDLTRLSSLKLLSEETGGFCVCQMNDFKKGIQRIDAETSDYYMIGYTPTNPDPLKLRRQIRIEVTRPNVGDLIYRPEYQMPRPKKK